MSLTRRSDASAHPARSAHPLRRKAVRLAALAVVLALPGVGLLVGLPGGASHAVAQEQPISAGNADSLKRAAVSALRTGAFDKTQDLIDQALQLRPDDPTLHQMDSWVSNFQEQRQEFLAERKKAFDQQVREVKLLQEKGYRSYAIRAATLAYGLSADEAAFRTEPWVRDLVKESADLGREYEQKSQWIDAMRVWGDLAAIEPLDAEWKGKLKSSTRRVRLLAVYTPEVLDKLRDQNQAESAEVEKLLTESRRAEAEANGETPATQPATTQPATQPADPTADLDDSFRSDWHDSVKGATMTMLRDAIVDADEYYFQKVEYKNLLTGGMDAVLALATTPGLEGAFPTLADAEAKAKYVEAVTKLRDAIAESPDDAVDRGRVDLTLRAVGAVNGQTLKLPDEVLVSEFADGALERLDPFTNVFWPTKLAEFIKETQGEFVGVGISIRSEENGDLRVISPLFESPAYEAGVRPDYIITHIDGKSAKGISDVQAVRIITGLPNTTVTLTLRSPDGTSKDYTLVRRKINVVSVKGFKQLSGGKWDYMIDPQEKVAYLHLTQFQKSTSDELAAAVQQVESQGARGVILDLRDNPGGLLQSAVEVCDQFMGKGLVVSTRGDRAVDVTAPSVHMSKTQRSDVTLPMVCLVNEYSASASEIVSGALKDRARALIVGTRSFGKGSVQQLYWLGRNEACLKLTVAHYYLPSGRCLHKEEFSTEWGVEPDVKVEMTNQQRVNAIRSRQALEVLREDGTAPTVALDPKKGPQDAEAALIKTDAQLSAAVLLMRMQLAGEAVM